MLSRFYISLNSSNHHISLCNSIHDFRCLHFRIAKKSPPSGLIWLTLIKCCFYSLRGNLLLYLLSTFLKTVLCGWGEGTSSWGYRVFAASLLLLQIEDLFSISESLTHDVGQGRAASASQEVDWRISSYPLRALTLLDRLWKSCCLLRNATTHCIVSWLLIVMHSGSNRNFTTIEGAGGFGTLSNPYTSLITRCDSRAIKESPLSLLMQTWTTYALLYFPIPSFIVVDLILLTRLLLLVIVVVGSLSVLNNS